MPWRVWHRVSKRTLYFAPDWPINPFQRMLNAALDPSITVVPVKEEAIIDGVRSAEPNSVFHLHWTAPILKRAADREEAERVLADFVDAVAGFQSRGGRLVWSVHNVLPHETRFRDLEVDLCRLLAERADRIHVLSADTPKLVSGVYTLDPARTVVIEHSSYLGEYPDTISRPDARQELGVGSDDKALLTIGGIRPYRGLDRLLDAVQRIDDADLRALIAGRPKEPEFLSEMQRRADADPRVVARFRHVRDDELQLWFGAADVAVLPYLDVLNSGGFWLAATFGVPVVAPRAGALARFEGEPHVRLFEPGDTESLRRTLVEALHDFVGNADARAAARAAAEARPPQRMAAEYAAMVRQLFTA